jgi:hypothetical protein
MITCLMPKAFEKTLQTSTKGVPNWCFEELDGQRCNLWLHWVALLSFGRFLLIY